MEIDRGPPRSARGVRTVMRSEYLMLRVGRFLADAQH